MLALPVSGPALSDFSLLLGKACNCNVNWGNDKADLVFHLPNVSDLMDTLPDPTGKSAGVDYYPYPKHHFSWDIRTEGRQQIFKLQAPNRFGFANGLYALLREVFGFQFLHPKQSVIPDLSSFTLPQKAFQFSGKPRFEKKGFHLHTMHPLELTDQLHNPDLPGARGDVERYIDWLARNGQNYFEFSLLEDVVLKSWVPYMRELTDYAADRGILCGVDVSLHMIQQKTFMLVVFPPKSFVPYKMQIRRRLKALARAGFEFINMEFATAEFVGGFGRLKHRLRGYILEYLGENYPHIKLVGREHVVKKDAEFGSGKGKKKDAAEEASAEEVLKSDKRLKPGTSTPQNVEDPERGVLIHTVMSYSLFDKKAPVYELKNFDHMRAKLIRENKVRETWYYPESAYWITFDNSVPLWIMRYLDARWEDMQVAGMGIQGHITFSSGWEWGYWLIDWAIANWCWEYEGLPNQQGRLMEDFFKGQQLVAQGVAPERILQKIFPESELHDPLIASKYLQERYLFQQDLIQYLCPSSATDEFPKGLDKQFQPRPRYKFKEIYESFEQADLDSLEQFVLNPLKEFSLTQQQLSQQFSEGIQVLKDSTRIQLAQELFRSLKIMSLRARHRYFVLSGLIEARKAVLNGQPKAEAELKHYASAAAIRRGALELVQQQEKIYRYPVERIARAGTGYTAYRFGYLYPVSELHFWKREEEQARRKNFSPFFMNIWDFGRIGGFSD